MACKKEDAENFLRTLPDENSIYGKYLNSEGNIRFWLQDSEGQQLLAVQDVTDPEFYEDLASCDINWKPEINELRIYNCDYGMEYEGNYSVEINGYDLTLCYNEECETYRKVRYIDDDGYNHVY